MLNAERPKKGRFDRPVGPTSAFSVAYIMQVPKALTGPQWPYERRSAHYSKTRYSTFLEAFNRSAISRQLEATLPNTR